MEEDKNLNISECNMHKLPFHMICTGCKKILCAECVDEHNVAAHNGKCISIFKYAKENIVTEFEKQITEFGKKAPEIEKFTNKIHSVIPELIPKT